MNTDIIKGKWEQIKGDLRRTWGNITDDEWESTKGDAQKVTGLVQQKYGNAKEDVSSKISEFFDKHTDDNYDLEPTINRGSSKKHPTEF